MPDRSALSPRPLQQQPVRGSDPEQQRAGTADFQWRPMQLPRDPDPVRRGCLVPSPASGRA